MTILVLLLLGYWPLPVNHGITGTFAEFRNAHVHAGIDFSTDGRIGLPVTAVADGEIYRIKVQYRGYGKVLYIRHPEQNFISVYAHLDRFMDPVESIVDQYRTIRKTRYPGDIQLEHPVPVLKGQRIGSSGETGVGWPHFHVEFRDMTNRPVNPGIHGFRMAHDHEAPVFRSLHLYPETGFSAINGVNRSTDFPVHKEGTGAYVLREITLEGPVLLSVSVDDRDGLKGPLGIHTLTLEIDGDEAYRFAADRLSFETWWQSSAIFDLSHTRLSPSRYAYNLFRVDGSQLESQSGISQLNLSTGTHSYRILAHDFNGNAAQLRGTFLVRKAESARPSRSPGGRSLVDRHRLWDASDPSLISRLSVGNTTWHICGYGPPTATLQLGPVSISPIGYNTSPRLFFARTVPQSRGETGLTPVPGTFIETAPGLSFLRTLKLSANLASPTDLALGWYRYDREKKQWKYLDSQINGEVTGNTTVTASHFQTARFAVFRDESPPAIQGPPFRYRDRLAWQVIDIGKGVDPESVVLTLPDGNRVAIDYDPDRKIAFYRMPSLPGTYAIAVRDLAGNRSSATGNLNPKHSGR